MKLNALMQANANPALVIHKLGRFFERIEIEKATVRPYQFVVKCGTEDAVKMLVWYWYGPSDRWWYVPEKRKADWAATPHRLSR